MAQILVCFILAQVLVAAAMASTSFDASSSGPSPAQAPKRITQSARKLGAPSPSPSSDHSSDTNDHSSKEKIQSPTTSVDEEAGALLESKSGSDHRHPFDKSVAGGGVILGGLATTFLVAIFCYIRATRRHSKAETPAAHQLP